MSETVTPEPEERAIPKGQGLAAAALLMVAVTAVARVTGMVQMMVIAKFFGASGNVNSFWAAYTIPNLVYFLVAGGATRTAFVPVFSEYVALGEIKQGWRVFSSVFWLLLIVGGLTVAAGSLFADQIARLSALGWLESAPGRVEVTARITRIVFPAQLFFVLGSLLMGALNAQKHFLWPAVGPVIYNLFFILGAFIGGHVGGVQGLDIMAAFSVLGAMCGNLLIQIPPLARHGAKLSLVLDLHDEGVRRTIRLAGPIILGLTVAEFNWVVVRILATKCANLNAVAILNFAERLWKLPSGLFAAAIAIAVLPALSEHWAKRDEEAYRRDYSFAMRNTLFMTLPVTVIMGALATPIVRMLFQRGEFLPETSPQIGSVLIWLTPGTIALSAVYVLARAFYARQDTRTPVIAGGISIAVCLGLGYPASRMFDVNGLAMVTSLTNAINAVLLLWLLRRQVGQLDGRKVLESCLRVTPACVGLGLVCWFGSHALEARLGSTRELAKLITVMGPLCVGGVVFLGLAAAFRVEELASAWRLVTKRRGSKQDAETDDVPPPIDGGPVEPPSGM